MDIAEMAALDLMARRQTVDTVDRAIMAAWKSKKYDTSQMAEIMALDESEVANRLARLRDAAER